MTRKHFIELAKMVAALDVVPFIRCDIAEGIARVCAQTNPLFDRDRFLKACGVQS